MEQSMNRSQQVDALFFPFLQIPSGHHHVADALIAEYKQVYPTKSVEKIDILAYGYGNIEKLVSSIYLKWITHFPNLYDRLYSQLAYKQPLKRTRQRHYELIFRSVVKKLMKEAQPEMIFFTHALPSNIVSVLKQEGIVTATTVNVYTDFFINCLWGINGIDYHFVPSIAMKDVLIRLGVKEKNIFITGIPIHPALSKNDFVAEEKRRIKLLISGGSLGTGGIQHLLSSVHLSRLEHVYVLCGKNHELYNQLISANCANITPLTYISSKKQINHLYEQVDAVVTKPGGVTISESLMKGKPIFVCDALPGQERINLQELTRLCLVQQLDKRKSFEQQIFDFFVNIDRQQQFHQHLDAYFHVMDKESITSIIKRISQHTIDNRSREIN
jgi:processive 1,2-diacylglycerol beta-glucosyltransferase